MKLSDEVLDRMMNEGDEVFTRSYGGSLFGMRRSVAQTIADVLLESITVEQLRELVAKKGMVVEPKKPTEEMLQEAVALYRAMIKPLERDDE